MTPTSKVVGDLALFAVSAGVDWDELRERPERFDLPASVGEPFDTDQRARNRQPHACCVSAGCRT